MHTLRLPLKTNKNTEGLFEKRFQLIARIHNQTVKHAKKLLTENKHFTKARRPRL